MRCVRYRILKGIRSYKRMKRHPKKRLASFLEALWLYAGMPVGRLDQGG
jgi:hypothetical protein